MNRIGPKALLIVLALLSLGACFTADRTMGDNLIPDTQRIELYTQDFALPVYQDTPERMPLTANGFALVGNLNTPIYGTTEAAAAVQLLNQSRYETGGTPQVQSCYLSINANHAWTPEANLAKAPQTVYVHRLRKGVDVLAKTYGNFPADAYEATPLNPGGELYFGDTLRINLSREFGQELLSTTQAERDSLELFVKKIPGLYLRTEAQDPGRMGGRLNAWSIGSMLIYVSYKVNGADSLRTFYVNDYAANTNSCRHASIALDSRQPSDYVYYEGLSGTKPYIDIRSLVHNIGTWAREQDIDPKTLVLSRAEFTFPVDKPVDGDYSAINAYPDTLYACRQVATDSTCNYLLLNDAHNDPSFGLFNRTKFNYSMNLTSWLQSCLRKDQVTEQDNLWLMGIRQFKTSSMYSYSTTTTYAFDDFRYTQAALCGMNAKNPPILRITYTILK